MSVFTEEKIRRLVRQQGLADSGVFELGDEDKLTPAARSFLNDRHIKIVSLAKKKKQEMSHQLITSLTDSAVYPQLFKLTKLYPYFLKSQRELHQAFQHDKCQQMGDLLTVVEQIVEKNILEDVSAYQMVSLGLADDKTAHFPKEDDQVPTRIAYTAPLWQMTCYETYIETGLIKQEMAASIDNKQDIFAQKVIRLLESLEGLIWLIITS